MLTQVVYLLIIFGLKFLIFNGFNVKKLTHFTIEHWLDTAALRWGLDIRRRHHFRHSFDR